MRADAPMESTVEASYNDGHWALIRNKNKHLIILLNRNTESMVNNNPGPTNIRL
jgi:hypothetical protein